MSTNASEPALTGLRVSADARHDPWGDLGHMGSAASYELIRSEHAAPRNRILVPTTGHSGGSPDCLVEVMRVTRSPQLLLWIRRPDGRTSVYVPGRTVYRVVGSTDAAALSIGELQVSTT